MTVEGIIIGTIAVLLAAPLGGTVWATCLMLAQRA